MSRLIMAMRLILQWTLSLKMTRVKVVPGIALPIVACWLAPIAFMSVRGEEEGLEDLAILQWSSVAGRNYALEVSSDLMNWSELMPEIAGNRDLTKQIVWKSQSFKDQAFYRVRKAPKSIFETNDLEAIGMVAWDQTLSLELASFLPLFDGQHLRHWKVPESDAALWTVEDAVLKVRSAPNQRASTLWTKEDYVNFVMVFDFKFGKGIVDSGIFIRNDDQIQIGISGSLQRDLTASPFIPGTGYPVEAEGVQTLLKPEEWNSMRIEVLGPLYVTWLNGRKVMTYTSTTAVEKGPIGIQLHGNRDMAIDYRDIRIASF